MADKHYGFLIVGAGLFGAVFAYEASKIKTLGWKPEISMEEGISRTIQIFRYTGSEA